jgi:hypothetical protein
MQAEGRMEQHESFSSSENFLFPSEIFLVILESMESEQAATDFPSQKQLYWGGPVLANRAQTSTAFVSVCTSKRMSEHTR